MSAVSLTKQLDAMLQPVGFARRNKTWNRKRGAIVQVIDLQVSKAGYDVTINAGVLDPEVHTIYWGNHPLDFIQQPTCTVTARVGQLIDDRDVWWPLTDENAASNAADKTNDLVLPFLDRMQSRTAMRDWLSQPRFKKAGYLPPLINLALIQILENDVADGLALLEELKSNAMGGSRVNIAEIAVRSGAKAQLRASPAVNLS